MKDIPVFTGAHGIATLDHVNAFAAERSEAGFSDETVSPKLLPDYTRKVK